MYMYIYLRHKLFHIGTWISILNIFLYMCIFKNISNLQNIGPKYFK